jgi:hypothetical protein
MIGRTMLITMLAALTAGGTVLAQAPADAGSAEPEVLTLTPEQLAKFFEEARVRRLTTERKQVAAEIREGFLFDEEKVEPAIKGLSTGAENTWADNAERICRAFALVDARFGKAYEQFRKGQSEAAAQALKAIISDRDTSYFAAAKRFCYAEALADAGRDEDAVDAHIGLVKAMSDRFSFSALALLRAGRTYEKMHRRQNAMALYKAWMDNFGLLDLKTYRQLDELVRKIAEDYKDPLGTLATKMSDVEQRLSGADSGRATQLKQREIVAMLDDLIATAEEQSSSSSSAGSQGGQQGKCKICGKSGCQGQCQAAGSGSGPPAGTGVPSSPATDSFLPGGSVVRPTGISDARPSDGSDDWGNLPPREKQRLLDTFKETMPERYREMLREYYKALASERGR